MTLLKAVYYKLIVCVSKDFEITVINHSDKSTDRGRVDTQPATRHRRRWSTAENSPCHPPLHPRRRQRAGQNDGLHAAHVARRARTRRSTRSVRRTPDTRSPFQAARVPTCLTSVCSTRNSWVRVGRTKDEVPGRCLEHRTSDPGQIDHKDAVRPLWGGSHMGLLT